MMEPEGSELKKEAREELVSIARIHFRNGFSHLEFIEIATLQFKRYVDAIGYENLDHICDYVWHW